MPSIDHFRDVSQVRSQFLSGSHRVLTDDQGKLVKASETLGTRFMQWRTPSVEVQTANRNAIEQFRAALTQAYGPEIANRVFQLHLEGQHTDGKNLSTRRIETALATAESIRARVTAGNFNKAQKFVDGGLDVMFMSVTGRDIDQALSPREKRELRLLVRQTLLNHPDIYNKKMDDVALRGIVGPVLEDFLATRFQSLAHRHQAVVGHLGLEARHAMEGGDILERIEQTFPQEPQKGIAKEAFLSVIQTMELLDAAPYETVAINQLHGQIDAQRERLAGLIAQLGPLVASEDPAVRDFAMALRVDLERHDTELGLKQAQIHAFDDNHPLSEANVTYAMGHWTGAALRVLERIAQGGEHGEVNMEGLGHIQGVRDQIVHDSEERNNGARTGVKVEHPDEMVDAHKADMMTKLVEAFELAHPGQPAPREALEAMLKECYVETLNRDQEWSTVQTDVTFRVDDRTVSTQSTVTPARQLGERERVSHEYEVAGLEGVCSESTTERDHAVNLCVSKLTDSRGRKVVSMVRHGIHSARGLPVGSVEREQANIHRAVESVRVAVTDNQPILQEALRRQREGIEEPVTLHISSLSLVTAGWGGDDRLWQDQKAAWEAISRGEPILMPVWDPVANDYVNIQVKVNVLAFNWGVNPGAMGVWHKCGVDVPIPRFGWTDEVLETNRASLHQLVGSLNPKDQLGGLLGEYLARDDVSEKDKRIARDLAAQIREIWNDESFKKGEGDVYKIASRIAVLTDMIGGTPMFNCKSGKDRTGHLDAEIKFLAAVIHETGKVPPYGKLSEEHQDVFTEFALHGGNHEIQRYNTGYAGYKTYNVHANVERMGSDPAREELYRGGGKFVKH